MNVDKLFDHLPFAACDSGHVDRIPGCADSKLCGAIEVGCNFSAMDEVFAGETGNVWAGAAYPFAFDHGDALALSGDRPREEFGTFAAADDDQVVLFGCDVVDASGCGHDEILRALPFVLCLREVHVGLGPKGDLHVDGFRPGEMHGIDVVFVVAIVREVGLDGFVQHGSKGNYIAEGDEGGGANTVRLVFLDAGMTKSNFLLIVQPVLIVGAEAGVENPLLEAEIAGGKVSGIGFVLRRAGVSGQIGNAGNDATAPMGNDLLCLASENFTREMKE